MAKSETRDQVVELWNAGRNGVEIASALEIATSVAYYHLQKAGIHPSYRIRVGTQKGGRCFTPEQDNEIAELYRTTTLGMKAIAVKYGCSPLWVRSALVRTDTKIRLRGGRVRTFSREEIDDIVRQYGKGSTLIEIAADYHTTGQKISDILKHEGVQPRRQRPSGAQHARWKGGITLINGYRYKYVPKEHKFFDMAACNSYAAEHRLIMAEHIGRPLRPGETVHHKNGKRSDNRLENLQLRQKNHGQGAVARCAHCGSRDIVYDEIADPETS